MTMLRGVTALSLCLVAIGGCKEDPPERLRTADRAQTSEEEAKDKEKHEDKDDDDGDEAEAEFKAAEGHSLRGEAEFTTIAQGVKVVVDVTNAPPGLKGIHIHEKPDCSNIAGKSMGEHFAPGGHNHALPDQGARHLGDLGNIEIREDGKGYLTITVEGANLKKGDPNSFLNRSIVIHQDTDKGSAEQPSGGSGAPMACGVIEED